MRTLSTTLTATQKSGRITPLVKAELSQGANTASYTKTRITSIEHEEYPYSNKATVVLDNADKTLTPLDYKGYKIVLSYGLTTSAGDEYSACAPLWVKNQELISTPGGLACELTCIGIPDLLAMDKALDYFMPSTSNDLTVKTLFTAVAGATSPHKQWLANTAYAVGDWVRKTTANGYAYKCTVAGTSHAATEPTWPTTIGNTVADNTVTWECASTDNPFAGCTAYTVAWDIEDSLIDSFTPKDSFKIYRTESRLAVLNRLIRMTGCQWMVRADGYIHVKVLVSSIASEWISPTGESGGIWTNTANAYDGDTATMSYRATARGIPSDYLVLTHAGLFCDKVRVWGEIGTTPAETTRILELDVYYDGGWHSIHNGTFTEGEYQEFDVGASKAITSVRMRFTYTGGNIVGQCRVFECGLHIADYYAYSLASGDHTFFAKAYRQSLVLPNRIIVASQPDDSPQVAGTATSSASYALLPVTKPYYARLASSAQASSIAVAKVAQMELQSAGGYGNVPMNVGSELYDYNLITDTRENDSRIGNVGWIRRRYNIFAKKPEDMWKTTFGFGWVQSGRSAEDMLSELETTSDSPTYFARLVTDDLYATNIKAEQIDLTTLDQDDIQDGTTYGRVLNTHLDSNGLKITDAATYQAGYNPSTKRRVFTAQPTVPYDVGDLWAAAGTTKRCTTANTVAYNAANWAAITQDDIDNGATFSRVQTASLTADGLVLLDQVSIGTTYGLVAKTDISAGHIILSTCEGDLDDVDDGATYGKVQQTILDAGYIQVGAGTKDVGLSGWHVSPTEIVGQSAGVDQVVLNTSGKVTAGAGAVTLDVNGITITSDNDIIFTRNGNTSYMFPEADGDIVISPSQGLVVVGAMDSRSILPNADSTYDIGSNLVRYANGYFDDIYGTTHCYDDYDDLAICKALRPCDDEPWLISTNSLPDFLKKTKAQYITERVRQLDAVIAARISQLQTAIANTPGDKQGLLKKQQWQKHIAELSKPAYRTQKIAQWQAETYDDAAASVTKAAWLALGALKQTAVKLESLDARLKALEGTP